MLVALIHLGAGIAAFFRTRKSDRAAVAAVILCDVRLSPASSRAVALDDVSFHHRYCGSATQT